MKKRIIIIANAIINPSMSGGDTFILEMVKRIPVEKFFITIITGNEGEVLFRKNGIENVEYLLSSRDGKTSRKKISIAFEYVKRAIFTFSYLRKYRPDPVCTTIIMSSNYYCDTLIIPFVRNIRCVLMVHMLSPNPFLGYLQKFHLPTVSEIHFFLNDMLSLFLINTFCVPTTFSVVTISRELHEACRSRLKQKIKIFTVHNGITMRYNKQQVLDSIPRKKTDFVWIGRDHPQKGIDDFKTVLLLLKKAIPGFTASVIGDVGDSLDAFISSNKLEENVRLHGVVRHSDIYQILIRSKIMIFTSHYESYGIVVLENMICGNIIVGYDIRTSTENFPHSMHFIPKFHTEIMADRLRRILENYPQHDQIEDNFKFASRFRWDNSYRIFRKVLNLSVT